MARINVTGGNRIPEPLQDDLDYNSQTKALGLNPFSPAEVGEKSAAYNERQLLDALLKNSQGAALNKDFVKPQTEQDKRFTGNISNSISTDAEGKAPPSFLERRGGTNPITEQQAWDEFLRLHGPDSAWSDPRQFAAMSETRLAELKRNHREKYDEAVSRYANYLKRRNATVGIVPDLRGQKELRETERLVKRFNRQHGNLTPLEDTGSKRGSKGAKVLTDKNRNDITTVVNNTNADMNDTSVSPSSFLGRIEEGERDSNIEKMEKDLGIDSQNKKYFSSVATLGLATITSIFKKHRYNKQAIADYLGFGFEAYSETEETSEDFYEQLEAEEMEEGVDAPVSKRISEQESLDNLRKGIKRRHRQPILHGLMSTLDKFIRDKMNPKGEYITQSSKSLMGAGGLLRYWTEQGYISWGRTKKGYVIPIVNDSAGLGNLSDTELMVAFNPELRTKTYSRVQASNYPLGGNYGVELEKGKIKSWTDLLNPNKDYKGRSGISEAFLTGQQNLRYQIDGDRLWFGDQMYKELDEDWKTQEKQGAIRGSQHPYASTFGGLSTTDYETYSRKDKEALLEAKNQPGMVERPQANEIQSQHKSTLGFKIESIKERFLEQVKDKVGYYIAWHKSPNTGRYFMDEELFNIINDKGVMRNLVNLGNMVPISIKGEFEGYFKNPRGKLYPEVEELFSNLPNGINWGQTLQTRLKKLPPSTRQAMGFFYALGKIASEYGVNQPGGSAGKVDVSNHQKAIAHGINSFGAMSQLGDKFRQYKKEGALPKHENLTPIERDFLTGKGEWGSALSLALDSSNLKESIKNNDPTFRFKFIFSEDSQQSNSMLIGTLIGDFSLGRLLGILPNIENERTDPETGLELNFNNFRELLVHKIDDITKKVLNNTNEETESKALANYFREVLNDTSVNGTKVITRGLQIATVYGKYAGYLYTEAEEMLDQTPRQRKLLSDTYGNTRNGQEKLIRDISQVYLQIANDTMGNIMGYQRVIKSVGQMIKSLNGPTEIPGIFPGESVNFGVSELVPVSESDFIGQEIEGIQNRLGGWLFPELEKKVSARAAAPSVRERGAVEARKRQIAEAPEDTPLNEIPVTMQGAPETEQYEFGEYVVDPEVDDKNNVIPFTGRRRIISTPYGSEGSQVINAGPVDIIQNMDSLMMGLTFMITGSSDVLIDPKTGKRKELSQLTEEDLRKLTPPEGTPIHDQIMSTADSVLLLNNAYNNIAPHVMSQGGRHFTKRLMSIVHAHCLDPIIDRDTGVDDNERFNIGTQSHIADVNHYGGITAYFDQIFLNLQKDFYEGRDEQRTRNKIVNNQEVINPDTGEPMTNQEWSNKKQVAVRKFLVTAQTYGYKDPMEPNRENYSVTGGQLKALSMLIAENEGILTETRLEAIAAMTNPKQRYRGKPGKKVTIPNRDGTKGTEEIILRNLKEYKDEDKWRLTSKGKLINQWRRDSLEMGKKFHKQNSTNTNLN